MLHFSYSAGRAGLASKVQPPLPSPAASVQLATSSCHSESAFHISHRAPPLCPLVQSRWLAGVAEGSILLPPQAQREADVARQRAWWGRSPFPRGNNHIWALHGGRRVAG